MKRWHLILLLIATAAMSFSYGYSITPKQPLQTVYVPVCGKLPIHVKFKPVNLNEVVR